MVKQNLIITKVVAWIKHEVLAFLLVLERKYNLTLEDHVQLCKVLTLFDDLLVSKEYMAVEVTHKVADEFVTCPNLFVFEHMLEIFDKGTEEIMSQRESETRFELVEENVAFHYPVVV